MNIWAIILCGGRGSRMGAGKNKTLLRVDGETVFIKSMRAFSGLVSGMILVTGAGEEEIFLQQARAGGLEPAAIIAGGKRRQDSVENGLKLLPPECDAVLIHDGARCFVTEKVILDVIESIRLHGSGVAARPVTDTVKRADQEGQVLETLDRSSLYAMQTPQGFMKKDLLSAYEKCNGQDVTDDAALMELAGYPVWLTPGDNANIKLTWPEDLEREKGKKTMSVIRMGQGFDAHRLQEGRKLILCGVDIPWEKGLLGHSDADVAVHALMDAMLGAAALPDIGHLFPDHDDRYRGISSMLLLKEVYGKIAEKGFSVGNADITIIAQAPKMAPHIEAMRQNVAKVLCCRIDLISVKATTTEHMGYEGRGEGISAMACVVLEKQEQKVL